MKEKSYLGLLENLSFKVGCMYLSDLRYNENLYNIQHELRSIDPNIYSLKEWNDAVNYITGERYEFDNVNEALDFLISI
ncbi:hypothetical protein [Anaerofustis stercorihominis]|uniref:hypothetical protein n=1 Tax=Anaerofustis stercorihominis TaxID=214853 RepID=UPI00214B8476|nr:hypothetical protein [Anaerofustis stercorihominis]MCR2032919.1 hypothetical protein [Anaerofustis stercorihominis]